MPLVLVGIAVIIVGGFIVFSSQPAEEEQSEVIIKKPQETMPTELEIEDITVGEGAAAETGDQVTVHYTGSFQDGSVFDTSLARDLPFIFTLGTNQVIQGWEQGILGMKVGGVRKLVIPPALAYGERGFGDVIPPNTTLFFKVELLGITGK